MLAFAIIQQIRQSVTKSLFPLINTSQSKQGLEAITLNQIPK